MNSAVLLTAMIALVAAPMAQQQIARPTAAAGGAPAERIPPVSYVCPMVQDADVVEDQPGKCRKCGMPLVPARLDSMWSCPVHGAVIKDAPGKCPLDGRDLIQMTMSVTWTCRNTDISAIAPGNCADGSPMQKKYAARAHGDHNPKHGGQFFMAPDNRHHLEGAFPQAGVFRLYLYDDYTKPLPRDQMRTATAKVVAQQVDGKAQITPTPAQSFTLAPVRNGRYLEAKIGKSTLPAALQAKVKFQADAPEHVFDFTFDRYSKEPTPSPAGMTMPTAASAPSSAAPATVPRQTAGTAPAPSSAASATGAEPVSLGVDPALIPLPIPDTVPELLAQLRTRTNQIKRLIDAGAFDGIYVPAFQAKDLAVALEAHNELPADNRKSIEPAIAQLVRSAYLLDMLADIGNKQQTLDAYERFAAAVTDIESAFPK
jgi:heavy metal-binding protein